MFTCSYGSQCQTFDRRTAESTSPLERSSACCPEKFKSLITATLPYLHTWCGLSANLECMSEMCCVRLAEIQDAKNRHFGTIAQLCLAVSSQRRHASTIEKNLLNSNTSSTCLHNMVNFSPLTAEICWRVWGTPANFNGFRVLGALLHGTAAVGVSQTLRR